MSERLQQGAVGAAATALLASSATLICCVLPAMLVSLGAGAVLVGLVTTFPQLIWLSEHKSLVFTTAGLLLILSGAMIWHARRLPCPIDPEAARACTRLRVWSTRIYMIALIAFAFGFLFAFVLGQAA